MESTVMLTLLGLVICIVPILQTPPRRILRIALPFAIPLLLAIASLSWSNHPDLALRRVGRFGLEVGMLAALVATYDLPARLICLWHELLRP